MVFSTSRLQSVVGEAGPVLREDPQSVLHDDVDVLKEMTGQ